MTIKPIIILAGLALLVGCAKDRPEQIGQAASVNLLEISEFQGREFNLSTEDALHSGSTFTNAANVTVENGTEKINDFRLVGYKTDSNLFEDVPFFGKPKTEYKLNYELTPTFLIINKLSKKEDLPFHELTIAEKQGSGLYKVPMVGYPVTLFKLRRVLNINNEGTHQFDTDVVYDLNKATHFKIDLDGRKNFEAINKNNVFDANLLDGEWFYAATVVSASPEQANSIGRDLSFDFKARSVSRIKFLKRSDSIVGVNLNIDDNIDVSEEINLKKALTIPTEWIDFKKEMIGDINKLSETEVGDDHEEKKPFNERKYMRIKFEKTQAILTGTDNDAIFDSLEMGKDYLAYVIYYPTQEIKIRYSLRKAHAPKKGRVYFKKDRKVFGFFSTRRYVIENHRFHRESDYEKLVFMNRFYPEDGKIVYYFSHNTPDHMREAGRRSIKVWNDAFKSANTGIQVVLDESRDVNLGDIRYNIINIVDTKDGARLLGYGPSIVDSESGEIIAATSNIYANPFRETWIETLRNYIRSRTGMIDDPNIAALNPEKGSLNVEFFSKLLSTDNSKFSIARNSDRDALLNELGIRTSDNLEAFRKILKEENGDKPISNLSNNHYNDEEGMFHQNAFDLVYKDSVDQIENKCKDILEPYLKRLTVEGTSPSTAGELLALNTCADRLLEESVVSTLVHELGHNFGLRHNFLASTDTKNFLLKEDGTPVSQTSSIMDYQPGQVTELVTPGPYDVAAIRYGYGNAVETNSQKSIKIDTDWSLVDQKLADLKKYKFCTDEHVQRTNPLCQRHDHGVTPLEVAETIINSFDSSYTLYGHRLDRNRGRYAMFQLSRTFIPLKLIYDQWRFHLREFLGERYQYLESITPEKLEAKLKEMKADKGRHGKNFAEYYKASERIYNFFKEIVYTPALQCVLQPSNGVERFLYTDFKGLKESIYKNTGLVAKDCMHAELLDGSPEDELKVVGYFGKFHEEQKVSLDISDIDDYNNTNAVGFAPIRSMALMVMTMRAPLMQHLAEEQFAPNFMDNPNYRAELLKLNQERITKGINGSTFKFPAGHPDTKLLFATEKEILVDIYTNIANAMNVPGKIEASMDRRQPVLAQVVRDQRLIPEGAAVSVFGSIFIYATDAQPLAKELINKRNKLLEEISVFDGEITVPNGEEIFNEVKKVAISFFKTAEELSAETFTIKDFIDHVEMVKVQMDTIEAKPETKKFLADLFNLPVNISNFFIKQIEEDAEYAKKHALPEVKSLLVQNNIPEEAYPTIMTLEGTIPELRGREEFARRQIELRKDMEIKREEYEAQLDVITQILLKL
jgi:hypothetical protein